MNIVSRYRPATQFRCLPLVGNSPFDYVQRLPAADGSNNYQPARDLVGAFLAMNEKGREVWNSLTGGTGITGESKFALLAMTGKSDRSSSCAAVTRTSACSLLSGSGKNLKGWMDEH